MLLRLAVKLGACSEVPRRTGTHCHSSDYWAHKHPHARSGYWCPRPVGLGHPEPVTGKTGGLRPARTDRRPSFATGLQTGDHLWRVVTQKAKLKFCASRTVFQCYMLRLQHMPNGHARIGHEPSKLRHTPHPPPDRPPPRQRPPFRSDTPPAPSPAQRATPNPPKHAPSLSSCHGGARRPGSFSRPCAGLCAGLGGTHRLRPGG